jgi:O-antigen/teichoic acid export membrane protein
MSSPSGELTTAGPREDEVEALDSNEAETLDSSAASLRSVVRSMLMRASATLVLQGFSLLAGFATTVLLAHLLGGLGYGRYTYAIAWASLLTTPAILGLDRFLVRSMAVYEVQGRWELVKGLLRRTNALVLATATAMAIGACVVSVLALDSHLRWTFCVAMLLIPLGALTLLRQGAMQALGQVVWGQLPEYVVRPVLVLAGVGALYLLGKGALTSTTALAANVAAVTAAFAVGAIMLRRALPAVLRTVAAQYETRSWLRASLPMMWFGAVWYGNKYVATLVVGTIAGPRAAGVYSAVERGAELIVLVLVAANMPLAPVIARMYARRDRLGLQHATERVAQATLLVSAPIAAFFAIFPSVYLGVFGASFQTGATALTILAIAQAVNAAAGPTGNVLIMTGYERAAVGGIAVGLLANIVLGVLLVPPLGVTGGAIASGSSLVLWNLMLAVRARRRLGVNVTALPWLAVRQAPADD